MSVIRFLKDWTLPVAIAAGIVAYLIYSHVPLFDATRPWAAPTVSVVQPVLIFSMLFLSFCKIDARRLRPALHHVWLLLLQVVPFAAIALLIHYCPALPGKVVLESAALCLICPTATAAAVVTQKLGGDAEDIMTYTILANLLVALAVPLIVPLIQPRADMTFIHACWLILRQVFPMLICPFIAAQLIRGFLPKWQERLTRHRDLPFYLWAVALSIAIAITTRSIAHTDHALSELLLIALISLVTCILQFALGRLIGRRYGHPISCAQGLGQKNTVFAIWMGYTFLNPATSLAGGFYSIWHNLYNTYQLRQAARTSAKTAR